MHIRFIMVNMTIGERIDTVRKLRGVSYAKIAKALDITPQYFKKIRDGATPNVSSAIYKAFCYEYDIQLEWLVYGTGEMLRPSDVAALMPDITAETRRRRSRSRETTNMVDKIDTIMASEDETTKKALETNIEALYEAVKNKKKVETLEKVLRPHVPDGSEAKER
jgi:transcriptional regulator with XRE-family HTH domain